MNAPTDSRDAADHDATLHTEHVVSVRTNLTIFGVLMGLLVLTVVAAWMPFGKLALVIALLIASVKTVLIGAYFMHLRWSDSFVRLLAVGAIFWLALLIALVLNDTTQRQREQISQQTTRIQLPVS